MSNLVKGGNVPQRSTQTVIMTSVAPRRRSFSYMFEDILDFVMDFGQIIIGVLIVGIFIALGVWCFTDVNNVAANTEQQTDLNSEVTTSVSNIKHALDNERSVSYVQAHAGDYLATITNDATQVKIEPASCRAQRSETTYSVVGLIPGQHMYLVYNSTTGKYLSGSYTKASVIPDLTC